MALKWQHRREDLQFGVELGRGLVAIADDKVVGMALWSPYEARYATLGMMIVSPSMQGRGMGRQLMEAALQDAAGRNVILNATPEGLPLYEKLGFETIGAVHQHQGANVMPDSEALPKGAEVRLMAPADLENVVAFDEQAAGFRRAELLAALQSVGTGLVLERYGELAAWCFLRRFGRGFVIGPVAAYAE